MKKIFLPILFYLLLLVSAPFLANAAIVNCTDDCGITQFIGMFASIYTFIITIALPLGGISVTIGGIMMMISAGNPNLMSLGKKIFWSAVIGLFLALASSAIINFILDAIGYTG